MPRTAYVVACISCERVCFTTKSRYNDRRETRYTLCGWCKDNGWKFSENGILRAPKHLLTHPRNGRRSDRLYTIWGGKWYKPSEGRNGRQEQHIVMHGEPKQGDLLEDLWENRIR